MLKGEHTDNSTSAEKTSNSDRWPRSIMIAITAALMTMAIFYVVFEWSLELLIPWFFYAVPMLVVALLAGLRAWHAQHLGLVDDWKFLALVANSKLVILISVAFTFVPLAVSFSKASGATSLLPFTLYLYWISGIFLFLFLAIYKAGAPKVYQFSSFQDLKEKEGGVICLRYDAADVLASIAARKKTKPFVVEAPYLEGDQQILAALEDGIVKYPEDVYFIMREYSTTLKVKLRCVLMVLLFIPAFLIPTVTAIKMLGVGIEAHQSANRLQGWGKAIYQQVLNLTLPAKKEQPAKTDALPPTQVQPAQN
ncbi:hypothetical protein [Pseudomonas purpurea]|uniref:hypothetical protein n=1 Tax=Pseudomonas purpurea TaxID=3136737 RepID=UPI003263D76E